MTHSRIWLGVALASGALTAWGCGGEGLGDSGSGERGAPGAVGVDGDAGGGFGGAPIGKGGAGAGGGPGAGVPGGAGVGSGGLGGAAGGAGSSAFGGRGTGGCNSIDYPPPVLTVFDAETGTPICDPTFAIVVQTDAGLMSADAFAQACTPSPVSCPVSYDGGPTPCPFSIGVGYNTTGVTVSVSAPGYEPIDVPDVAAGRSGCIPPFFPASNLNVKLVRLPPDDGATSEPDGGATCSNIASEYANALPGALGCDVGAEGQCGKEVPLSLTCGCRTFVNDSAVLDALVDRWQNMGCTFTLGCPTGCPAYAGATCTASNGGPGTCQGTPGIIGDGGY